MPGRRLLRAAPAALAAAAALAAVSPAAAVDKLINTPAEKFVTAPGGVDMRTGRYVYSETDLSIGGESGGLALTRTLTANVPGHSNPFANLSHNWDMMVSETLRPETNAQGQHDLQVNVHFGGRSQTYAAPYVNSAGLAQMSSGLAAPLTYAGSRADGGIVYTYVAPDGAVAVFRPLGHDCSTGALRLCRARSPSPTGPGSASTMCRPAAPGGSVRLARVTSSRGYALAARGQRQPRHQGLRDQPRPDGGAGKRLPGRAFRPRPTLMRRPTRPARRSRPERTAR